MTEHSWPHVPDLLGGFCGGEGADLVVHLDGARPSRAGKHCVSCHVLPQPWGSVLRERLSKCAGLAAPLPCENDALVTMAGGVFSATFGIVEPFGGSFF